MYEGLRGYHLLPEAGAVDAGALEQAVTEVAGLTHAAERSQMPR